MDIVLIGYMGSGKSTVAKYLSHILNIDVIDLDAYIEQCESAPIVSIFKTKGEIYFRKKETQYLKEVLDIDGPKILALGGGTPCYSNNMTVIKNHKDSKSFYLKASITTLVDRLFIEKTARPLISHLESKEDLAEFIGKHLFERNVFYSQADFTIDINEKTIETIGEDIIGRLF